MSITVERSWPGGPLRQFSQARFKDSIAYGKRYAGAYVCESCQRATCEPLEGLRKIFVPGGNGNKGLNKWLCAFCEKD